MFGGLFPVKQVREPNSDSGGFPDDAGRGLRAALNADKAQAELGLRLLDIERAIKTGDAKLVAPVQWPSPWSVKAELRIGGEAYEFERTTDAPPLVDQLYGFILRKADGGFVMQLHNLEVGLFSGAYKLSSRSTLHAGMEGGSDGAIAVDTNGKAPVAKQAFSVILGLVDMCEGRSPR